ncbi:MAG: hypothetical protein Q8K60_02475 [Parachlamydiaceae bacterium]|nr:hypothetical protein [Parachlamydiaceae bacterium]
MSVHSSYSFSCFKQLHEMTQKKFSYYHEVQLIFFTGLSFVGTNYFLSIYSERAITFSAIFYGSSYLLQQGIKQIPWSKENKVLLRIEQIMHISTTFIVAKIISHLFREPLTLYQCLKVTGVFFIAYYIFLLAYRHFSNYFNPFKKDLKLS